MSTSSGNALRGVDITYLHSKHVGDEFEVLGSRSSDGGAEVTSVLLVTDPIIQYCTAVEMVRMLRLAEHIPELLVVGVGYRATRFRETGERRRRDLTPTASPTRGGGGDAAAFLAFLEEELKPYLAATYALETEDYTYFGNSFGGLFGAWVLLTEPATFARYGLGSPALWWDDYAIFTTEAAYAASHDDLAARIFVGVGGLENPAGDLHAIRWMPEDKRAAAYEAAAQDQTDMEADAKRMVDRLAERCYPSLELEYRSFAGELHATAWPLSLAGSIRYLYDAPR